MKVLATIVGIYVCARAALLAACLGIARLNGMSDCRLLHRADAEWFSAISASGYRNINPMLHDMYNVLTPYTVYAFFPGFPYTFRYFHALFGFPPIYEAIVFNGIFAGLAAIAIYLLTVMSTRYVGFTAQRQRISGYIAVALLSTMPMSITFSLLYSEAMFVACTLWALVAVLKNRWIWASILCIIAGVTRSSALGLIATIIISALWAVYQNKRDGQSYWRPLLAAVTAPLGWLGYILWVSYRKHELFAWFSIQTQGWGTHFDGGWQTLRFLFTPFSLFSHHLFSPDSIIYLLTYFSIFISVYLMVKSWRFHIPWQLSLYGTLTAMSILLSAGIVSSRPRLLMVACTLLIPLVIVVMRTAPRTRTLIVSACVLAGIGVNIVALVFFTGAL